MGNSFADNFTFFELSIARWLETDSKGNPWKSATEIDAAIDSTSIQLAMINNYFDFDDFNQPIKSFFDDQFFYPLTSGFTKNAYMYSKWWRYNRFIPDLILQSGLQQLCPFDQVRLPLRMRRMLMLDLCASWGGLRSHRRKANHRFTYSNGKIQICDLLFSCDSWVLLRKHTGPASTSFSFVAADVPGQMDKVVVSQTAGSSQEWIYCISITYYI